MRQFAGPVVWSAVFATFACSPRSASLSCTEKPSGAVVLALVGGGVTFAILSTRP